MSYVQYYIDEAIILIGWSIGIHELCFCCLKLISVALYQKCPMQWRRSLPGTLPTRVTGTTDYRVIPIIGSTVTRTEVGLLHFQSASTTDGENNVKLFTLHDQSCDYLEYEMVRSINTFLEIKTIHKIIYIFSFGCDLHLSLFKGFSFQCLKIQWFLSSLYFIFYKWFKFSPKM